MLDYILSNLYTYITVYQHNGMPHLKVKSWDFLILRLFRCLWDIKHYFNNLINSLIHAVDEVSKFPT